MNDEQSKVKGHPLAVAVRSKDRALRQRAVAWTVAWVLGWLLLLACVDDAWSLPLAVRWIAWASALAVIVHGVVRVRRLMASPTSFEEAARDVQGRQPGHGNEVVTAAEYLSGRRVPSNETERAIADALARRAARHVEGAAPDYRRSLAWPALTWASVAAALMAAFLAVVPEAWVSLARAALPWSGASHTRIEPSHGDGEVPIGALLAVTNRIAGRVPRTAEWMQREGPGQPWSRVSLAVSNGVARHAFTVKRAVEWRVAAGDGLTRTFRLDAYMPPAATNFSVRLTPPAYTRRRETTKGSPDVSALRGTRALWSLDANVPLASASLRLTNGIVVPLRPDGDRRWSTDIHVLSNMAFTVVLADAKGRPGIDATVRRVRALADAPPTVEVTLPGRDIRALPTDTVPISMAASDDHGVASMELVFHKLGEPARKVSVPMEALKDGKVTGRLVLALAPLKLREYELVAYHAEARDFNDVDGPGVGRSPEYFIEMTDKPELAGKPMKSQRSGQQVNLLTVQKQIVADTAVLPRTPSRKATEALAQRQRDALDLAMLYREKAMQKGGPAEAVERLGEAMKSMEAAAGRLDAMAAGEALPPEEKALASLYQTLKSMPEIQPAPPEKKESEEKDEAPPEVDVVLKEMQRKRDDPARRAAIEQAVKELEAMAKEQATLNAATESPAADKAEGSAEPRPGEGRNDEPKADAQQAQASEGSPESKGEAEGKGEAKEGKAEAQGQGKGKGEGKGEGEGEPGTEGKPGKGGKGPGMAGQQGQLGEQARQMSERLARMGGKGERAGQQAGQAVRKASEQMKIAAQSMGEGKMGDANVAGANAGAGLQSAIVTLQRALEGRAARTDASAEEAPARYEAPISEYFKRLTRAR